MSQTDKLISLTGLSRVLNTIKNFIDNRINNTSKKIRRVEPMLRMVGELEVGFVTLNPNEYMIIDNMDDIDELKISVPNAISGSTLSYSTNDYTCEFTIPASNRHVKITVPSNVKWKSGNAPSFIPVAADMTYVISIVNGLGEITNYSTSTAVTGDEE
jgi:hypothetical protein